MRSKTLRGLDLIVYVNGKPWAFADSLDWTIDYGAEPTFTIDQQVPAEITTTRALITGNLHYWRQHNTAGAEGAGMVPTQEDLSRERYFYLQVTDRRDGTTYLEIPKTKIRQQTGSGKARGVVDGTVSFYGMGWQNEF